MRPNIHTSFIISPITEILTDVVSASVGIGSGIETFPMCDYVMQSAFLKMTGFQEQKLKCICWELASVDFEYRYDYKTNPVGERSSYNDKQTLYKDLIRRLQKRSKNFEVASDLDKNGILDRTTTAVKEIFAESNLSIWSQKSFNEYGMIWNEIKTKHFANDNNNLFTALKDGELSLQVIYRDYLYRFRNRIAHNTQSYQQNLPTLNTLVSQNYKYENYFIWFSTLVLIDEIFRELYRLYLQTYIDQ
ncbi:hypothetical protein ACQ9BO_09135 [Flavobacterium sp. P21]|uniref:hypothetical protein n=1 Tax=Flavobacterium sp. P21 TaxID=3423948 RepID=UPI003D67F93F